jgi:hypothetical protein
MSQLGVGSTFYFALPAQVDFESSLGKRAA